VELAHSADVILSCLTNDEAMQSVYFAGGRARFLGCLAQTGAQQSQSLTRSHDDGNVEGKMIQLEVKGVAHRFDGEPHLERIGHKHASLLHPTGGARAGNVMDLARSAFKSVR